MGDSKHSKRKHAGLHHHICDTWDVWGRTLGVRRSIRNTISNYWAAQETDFVSDVAQRGKEKLDHRWIIRCHVGVEADHKPQRLQRASDLLGSLEWHFQTRVFGWFLDQVSGQSQGCQNFHPNLGACLSEQKLSANVFKLDPCLQHPPNLVRHWGAKQWKHLCLRV